MKNQQKITTECVNKPDSVYELLWEEATQAIRVTWNPWQLTLYMSLTTLLAKARLLLILVFYR